jgi:transposase
MARLLPPESSSVEHVSREVGVSMATLERWRADVLANGPSGGSQRWTAAARLQAVIATAAMEEATRSVWCREQGLYPAELDAWKQDALAGLGEPRAANHAN